MGMPPHLQLDCIATDAEAITPETLDVHAWRGGLVIKGPCGQMFKMSLENWESLKVKVDAIVPSAKKPDAFPKPLWEVF